MESMIRSDLNESTTVRISSAEILTALNEAYKEVASRGLSIEQEDYAVTTEGCNFVKTTGNTVTYVELVNLGDTVFFLDTPDVAWQDTLGVTWQSEENPSGFPRQGLQCISPLAVGYIPILRGTFPQYWFPWGKYIFIEPKPDDRYLLRLYYADTPTAAMTTGTPEDLPIEFHPCVPKFAAAMLCIKLKRWADVTKFYNLYITSLQGARALYIKKYPDLRAAHVQPDSVEVKNG
jgi:hypothetical protein